jgi:ribonucleotide monophosphatase NagD (HAD superfamily)
MHNGVEALPGAVECIAELKRRGKRFVILSNTSAPNRVALNRLAKYGFHPHDFVGAVTSGEVAAKHMRATYGSGATTAQVLLFTWDSSDPNNPRLTSRPEDYLQECGNVQVAANVGSADVVLVHGSEVWYRQRIDQVPLAFIDTGSYSTVDPILAECAKKGLPMVCANADFVVQTPTGGVAHMPGKIAQRYQDLGGQAIVFGYDLFLSLVAWRWATKVVSSPSNTMVFEFLSLLAESRERNNSLPALRHWGV